MDKKDIYEHLANIYLDASSNKKKEKSKAAHGLKNYLVLGLAFTFSLSFFFMGRFSSGHKPEVNTAPQIALILYPDILKINFNFDPAKKETCTIALNKLNLSRYKTLGFSVKKDNPADIISLRVEFTNAYNEKAFIYLKDIAHIWTEYIIAFSDFKTISDWTEMKELTFIVEEWNAGEKKDIVYLENVRVLL